MACDMREARLDNIMVSPSLGVSKLRSSSVPGLWVTPGLAQWLSASATHWHAAPTSSLDLMVDRTGQPRSPARHFQVLVRPRPT